VTPLKAIRAHCLWCMGGDGEHRPFALVRECDSAICPLVPFREGKRGTATSPARAIVATCWDCLAGDAKSVKRAGKTYSKARPTRLTRQCEISDCALFPHRAGKRA